MATLQAVTVTQLNAYIKAVLSQDDNLRSILVCGEISNFKRNVNSGHLYFVLKDEKSSVRAVMFAGDACRVPFELCDGMNVLVMGSVSCYEAAGQYQIYVKNIQPDGVGAACLAFEQLKEKLLKEGLFDSAAKKPLPEFPKTLGVITSKTGAVIHDIQVVSQKRYPLCKIVLYPADVQGNKALEQIIAGIKYFNSQKNVDVIIIGRGGGSAEDLYVFNNETLARAIYNSCIPIVSAVGHETDFTICDFVADVRAATPSAAAEIALPDIANLKNLSFNLAFRIQNALNNQLEVKYNDLKKTFNALKNVSPAALISNNFSELKVKCLRLVKSYSFFVSEQMFKLKTLESRLKSCSRKAILNKGYALITSGDNVIKSVYELKEKEKFNVTFADGAADVEFKNINISGDKNGEK